MKEKKFDNNIELKFHQCRKIKKNNNIKKNKTYKKIFIHDIFKKSIVMQSQLNKLKEVKKNNIFSNLKNNFLSKINHIYNKKNNTKILKNDDNSFFFKETKNKKFNTLLFKNFNKENSSIQNINIFKDINKTKNFQYDVNFIEFSHLEKNDEWKKAISQQVLLSIANKENKAEIHFKPEYLSPINIKIKIKNDKAMLNFISNHNEIKTFLKDSIPFLQSELIKNGIKLDKINICKPGFEEKKISEKNISSMKNYVYEKWKSKNIFIFQKNDTECIDHQYIDMYI
ncbi:flagellar hook-length control protein FliK [Buchnera aphidicola]|uniref:flagellar hook-length control protein FliK n=1 Tax=Buchnera aphidicola TaxID=9 RepID=UPI0034646B8C